MLKIKQNYTSPKQDTPLRAVRTNPLFMGLFHRDFYRLGHPEGITLG